MRWAWLKHWAGLPGVAGPAKNNRALRWVWGKAGHRRGAAARPSRGSVPWLVNRALSIDGPSGISLPAPRTRHARLPANVPWGMGEGQGHTSVCAFQPGLGFGLFFRFQSTRAWPDTVPARGAPRRPSGPSRHREATCSRTLLPQQQLPPLHLGPLHLENPTPTRTQRKDFIHSSTPSLGMGVNFPKGDVFWDGEALIQTHPQKPSVTVNRVLKLSQIRKTFNSFFR